MSLTEALHAGDPEVFGLLYDEYGARLYAYCHSVVGDEAADAVRDAFVAAARHSAALPSDDGALPVWLHALTRAECVRRGALVRRLPAGTVAPLERALARLRPEHRDALALSAALETDEFARVVGVARDTAELLAWTARRRLEQAVIAVFEAGAEADDELLTALAQGRLPALLSRRAATPPTSLRARVVAACFAAERAADGALLFDKDGLPIPLDTFFGPAEAVTRPVPKTGDTAVAASPGRRRAPRARRHGMLAQTLGLAACAAAVVGAVMLWPQGPGRGVSPVDGHSRLVHPRPRSSHGGTPAGTSGGATPLEERSGSPAGDGSPTGAPPKAEAPSASAHSSPLTATGDPTPSTSATPTPTPEPTTPTPSPTPSAPSSTPSDGGLPTQDTIPVPITR